MRRIGPVTGVPDVISCDLAAYDLAELTAEIERRRAALLGAVVGVLIALLRASKVQIDYERLPEGGGRSLRATPLQAESDYGHPCESRGELEREAGLGHVDRVYLVAETEGEW